MSSCGLISSVKSAPQEFLHSLQNSKFGNTCANLNDGGLAAESDGWIYYANSDRALYKMRDNGSDNTWLTRDRVSNINVIGDTMYYIPYLTKQVYSIKTDGTDKHKLDFFIPEYSKFLVVNDWIVYNNGYDLNIIKTNGTQNMKIASKIWDRWILDGSNLFFSMEDGTLSKIDLNSGKQSILKKNANAYSLCVADGAIYYTILNGSKEETKSIYMINEDGSGFGKIYSDISTIFSLVQDGNKLYCTIGTFNIFRLNFDGTNAERLTTKKSRYCQWLNVAGNWLFYENRALDPKSGDYNYTIYHMKNDGTSDEFIAPFENQQQNSTNTALSLSFDLRN
jgi:hypothetical protein